jgi:C4-dicarboxylate-specific signal transduction histidine kinase
MTSWDIAPDGVRSVLSRTEAVAAEFETQMTDLNTALMGAATQSSSNIVAEALSGYAESAQADLGFVFTRTGACMTGAANATNAYLDGDLQMAADAQAAATAAPAPLATMPGRGGNVPR